METFCPLFTKAKLILNRYFSEKAPEGATTLSLSLHEIVEDDYHVEDEHYPTAQNCQ